MMKTALSKRGSLGNGRRNGSHRGGNRKIKKRSDGKEFWTGLADTAFFQPHKDDMLPVWRDMYKLNRQVRELERGLYQPTPSDETWLGSFKSGVVSAWHDLVDEVKALLAALFFHIVTFVLIVAFNAVAIWFLFWLIRVVLFG